MKNPWLSISYNDYEQHMNDPTVNQLMILNEIILETLTKYNAEKIAIVGCSTGNGFEHLRNSVTKEVHAIDINPDFLKILNNRFGKEIQGLHLHQSDIDKDDIGIVNIDLIIATLILEYVDLKKVIPKLCRMLSKEGIITIIIQKTLNDKFVTKTKYRSLEELESISHEVDEVELSLLMKDFNIGIIDSKEIELNKNKLFKLISYKKTN